MVEFDEEGLFMKIDEKKDAVPDTVSAGDQQNRREFFNGLGKWSMIVVAAVSLLRGPATQVHAGSGGVRRPEWEPPETGVQRFAAKKHRQHVDIPPAHGDAGHQNVPHVDTNIQQRGGQPSGQPSGPPPTKMYE
jgi:hypothetical protein